MIKQTHLSSLVVRSTLSLFAVVFSSAVPGAAQMGGVPASVLSMGTTHGSYRMGVPVSGTSLGPRGYNFPSCHRPRTFGHPGFAYGHDQFGHRIIPIVYTYYPYVQAPAYTNDEFSQNQQQAVSSAYQTGYEQGRLESEVQQLRAQIAELKESQIEASRLQAAAEPQGVRPSTFDPNATSDPNATQSQDSLLEPVAVLVFRGGRTVELRSYAIASGSILNVQEGRMEMISPDDIDVEATRQLNESRGLSTGAGAILEAVNSVNRPGR